MTPFKIGLLPFYLELYDRLLGKCRPAMDAFAERIAEALRQRGAEVFQVPVCRLAAEFDAAVSACEASGVDALVTLHLAYSPSLESIRALAATRLPLIVLDTTPAFGFGPEQDPAEIMYNHGIHGVQDMCNLLIRKGKPFVIEAGHGEQSDVLDRVLGHLPAARLARSLSTARVGLIGHPFAGMGDFAVNPASLRHMLGATVVSAEPAQFEALLFGVEDRAVDAELAMDRVRYETTGLDAAAHTRAIRTGLALRQWLEQERLTAFTMNFEAAGPASGLPVMPFLEISKAMTRGLGYAGEGDTLTAALVGALAAVYPDTTFSEMFCPDWKDGRVFLSHMGEFNLSLAAGKPVLAEPGLNFTPGESPVVAYGCLRAGEALWVNLAPLPGDKFRLIVAPGSMEAGTGEDRFGLTVRGWFKPRLPVAEFLAEYSRQGGTHHAALVYGGALQTLLNFAHFSGIQAVVIG